MKEYSREEMQHRLDAAIRNVESGRFDGPALAFWQRQRVLWSERLRGREGAQ